MKYYSVAECRKHIESLCAEFELCPKYCHLQTNVSSCFHFQLKECKGICCDKESVEEYNKRVKTAIKSVGIGTEDYQFFVEPKKDNRDVQRIITSYLKKKSLSINSL